MPCPHFSCATGECVLQQEHEADDDDPREAPVEEPTSREWCLGPRKGYRNCPVFKRFVAELLP